MCVDVFFKTEKKVAGSMAELAALIGGMDALVIRRGYGRRKRVIGDGNSCLCPVDIEKTFAPTEYDISEGDGMGYTAVKPEWILDRDRREHDRKRYEMAVAEMRQL